MTTTQPGQNDKRFEDALAKTREWARDDANGKRALAKLARALITWSVQGVVDTTPNKHGKGVDDAAKFYDEYAKAHSKKDNHGANGVKTSASKLRSPIKFGGMTTVDPEDVMDRALRFREEMAAADPKSVQDEYKSIVAVCREQLKNSDDALTDDQLRAAVGKPEAKTKEHHELWEDVHRTVKKILTGENRHGVKDQSNEAIAIEEMIRSYSATLNMAIERNALIAKARELGLDVKEDEDEGEFVQLGDAA